MARNRPAVTIKHDLIEAGEALGAVAGMSSTVRTSRYTGAVLEYAHGEMAREFDQHMAIQAEMKPALYHHVFDWRDDGDNVSRQLWRHKLSGRGASREATFEWIAAKNPIPTPEQYKEMGEKRFALIPDEELAKLSKRRYFFYWKAPIMEYGMSVRIKPRWSKVLFIPTGNASRPFILRDQQVLVDNPGGATRGAFTHQYTSWWSRQGKAVFERSVQRAVVEHLEESVRAGTKKRARQKTVSLSTAADFNTAFAAGAELAEAYLSGKAESYRRAGKYVEEMWKA